MGLRRRFCAVTRRLDAVSPQLGRAAIRPNRQPPLACWGTYIGGASGDAVEDLPEHWRNATEAAHLTVKRAEDGDAGAGAQVLSQAIIGLRCMLRDKEPPDPHRLVYLLALLESLEGIEQGGDPGSALHLKQGHRRVDAAKDLRDVLLFVSVGKALDELTLGRGHTRQDGPVAAALKSVAKNKEDLATVQKAWRMFGAKSGWAKSRSDWK